MIFSKKAKAEVENVQDSTQGNMIGNTGKPKKVRKKMSKKMSKKMKRWIFVGVGVAVLALIVLPRLFTSPLLPEVQVRDVVKGDVQQTVESSGIVQTERETTYFSPVTANVDAVNMKVGDPVKAGEVLLTFNAEELENQRKQAELAGQAGTYGYQDAITRDNKNASEYNRSSHDIGILEQQVKDWTEAVEHLNSRVAEYTGKQAESAEILAAKQGNAADAAKEQAEAQTAYDAAKKALEEAAPGSDVAELTKKEAEAKAALEAANEKLKAALTAVQEEQDNAGSVNEKLADYQSRLKTTSRELSEFTENLAVQKGIRSSSEAAKLTGAARAQLSANEELNSLNTSMATARISEGKNGIAAEYSGIVTSVTAVAGGPAAQGGALFSIASTEQMVVELSVTKYDLEKLEEGQRAEISVASQDYQGYVKSISHLAQKNEKGTSVVKVQIQIENADENIYLGMEAKISVKGREAKGVLLVPSECINIGKDGSFCYIVENGILTKKIVEIGLSSDESTEIKSGLSFGDKVVVSAVAEGMEEGMAVAAAEE